MKHYLKLAAWYLVGIITTFIISIVVWEQVRPSLLASWEGETVVFEKETVPPTAFELWVASADTQAMLHNEFNKHLRDELSKEITEYESKR